LTYEKFHKLVYVNYNLRIHNSIYGGSPYHNDDDPFNRLMELTLVDASNPIQGWMERVRSTVEPEVDEESSETDAPIPATMDETKQMYHTKFNEPLHTRNTCIFHYLHLYTGHTNKSITSSHRSVIKSPHTQCKVPTNQESNSLAPRNRVQKLKIINFYRFTGDLLNKITYQFTG
jgi:hypothetical protein